MEEYLGEEGYKQKKKKKSDIASLKIECEFVNH